MVIYLYHEKHGTKVACSEHEAQLDCANGWKRGTPLGNALADTLEELRARWEAKNGKKPHHMKSADTLRKELEA